MRKDKDKTKDQLISELEKMRQQVAELKQSETKNKQTEEKLKYQLHFDQILLDVIPLPVFHKDQHLIYTGCNKAYEDFLNISRDQFIGKSAYDISPKELADIYHAKDLELLQNPGIQIYESNVLDKTSREHNVIFHKTTYADADGRIAGLIGVIEDTTERKQAENELQRSESELAIMNKIAQMFLTIPDEEMYGKVLDIVREVLDSPQGIFGYISEAGELVIPSLTREVWQECKMQDKSIVFPPHTWGDSLWGRAIRDRRPDHANRNFKVPDGHIPITSFLAVPLIFQGQTIGLISVANRKDGYSKEHQQLLENITSFISPILNARNQRDQQERERMLAEEARERTEQENRRLEERLNRAEKMEALGTMAGGVAHDLNNILGVVVGYAELILMNDNVSSSIRSQLENIMKGGQRAAAVVDDLLALARRGVPNRQVINLNKITAKTQQSPEFENLLVHHPLVTIKVDIEPDLLNVSGSSIHLAKTLFNLVLNASEAMPKGGILTIKTANQYLDKPIRGYDEVREGDYVVLSISDTGEGIPAADLKRIFEPFYTRKIMGRSGTGLGLAVVWGTVKDHQGYINVQSEEGRGSTFTLYFPVAREEISSEAVAIAISEYMGGGETILVVDDVKEQRELATNVFRKLNYNAASVSSGEEAIAYMKEHHVDLMVLDMIMDPGMDGLDTYKRVIEIHPQQKVIIVSGFSESDRVHEAQALGAGAYVRKPYVIEKLGLAARNELNGK